MRPYARHMAYRGLPITVRWFELDRGDSWGPGTRRFAGSYLVAAPGPAFGIWQYLYEDTFDSYDAASAHALAAAQRAIDLDLGPGSRPGVADRSDAHQEAATQA